MPCCWPTAKPAAPPCLATLDAVGCFLFDLRSEPSKFDLLPNTNMRAHTHHPPAGCAERLLVLAQPNLAEYLDSKYGAGEPMVEAEAEAEAEPVDRPRPPVRCHRCPVPPASHRLARRRLSAQNAARTRAHAAPNSSIVRKCLSKHRHAVADFGQIASSAVRFACIDHAQCCAATTNAHHLQEGSGSSEKEGARWEGANLSQAWRCLGCCKEGSQSTVATACSCCHKSLSLEQNGAQLI